jgi:ribosomal protein S18 acetylase RimI-like enzyme
MSLYNQVKHQLPEFNIELVTLENVNKYENIFYSNKEYYMITDGHTATQEDVIEVIEYSNDFPADMCFCLGFSKDNEAIAFLSFFEGYPEENTLYIGLFLVDSNFQRISFGSKIISTLIDTAFHSKYNSIKLSVQDNNHSGYSFWTKLGFEIVEKTKCDGFYNLSMELTHDV